MIAPGGGFSSRRDFGRPGRRVVGPESDADRRLRLEEIRSGRGLCSCGLPQRRHVIEDPEPTTVRAGDEIGAETCAVVLDLQVAHGDRWHIESERLPVIAVVERHPHLRIGRRVEQSSLTRIFADGVRHCARRDAVVDLGPGLAAIVRAPEMRVEIVDPHGVGGGVGGTAHRSGPHRC